MADGYAVIISEKGFYAYRAERGPVGPNLPTFAGQVDNAWVFRVASRSLSLADRQEQATRNYALFCVFEAA